MLVTLSGIVIEIRVMQPENALRLMLVKLFGIVTWPLASGVMKHPAKIVVNVATSIMTESKILIKINRLNLKQKDNYPLKVSTQQGIYYTRTKNIVWFTVVFLESVRKITKSEQ